MAGKYVLLALGMLAPVALVGLVKTAERRHWSAMLDEAGALEAHLRALPRERESAVGETSDGRAWDHYDAALASVRARGPAGRDVADFSKVLLADDPSAREERARWLAAWAAELADVRRGVRARDLDPRLDWDAGLNLSIPRILDVRLLSYLCVADAVQHLEAGRPRQAVEGLLEAMQWGHDLLDHPVTIVAIIGSDAVVIEPVRDLLAERGLGAFDADALDALARGLARLDAGWPRRVTCLTAEPVLFVNHLELVAATRAGIDVGAMFGHDRWTWRYFGSARAGLADGVRSTLEWTDRLGAEPTRMPRAEFVALEEAVSRSANPVVREFWGGHVGNTLASRRDAAVRLRSLRHALAVARGLPAPPVDDPFGLTTTVTEEDGQVVVRTPRRSGRDPIEVRVRR